MTKKKPKKAEPKIELTKEDLQPFYLYRNRQIYEKALSTLEDFMDDMMSDPNLARQHMRMVLEIFKETGKRVLPEHSIEDQKISQETFTINITPSEGIDDKLEFYLGSGQKSILG